VGNLPADLCNKDIHGFSEDSILPFRLRALHEFSSELILALSCFFRARLRDNLKSVRQALTEMRERCILSKMLLTHEKLVCAPSKGRPKIVDAIWCSSVSLFFLLMCFE
jgi:hypothetical protein